MLSERSIILDVTATDGEFETRFLESLGHPVLGCHGPDFGRLCPVLKSGCSLVEGAHGVVFQLDLTRPVHRAILKRYQEVLADDVPLWACVQPGQDDEYAELLRGVEVVVGKPGVGDLDGFASLVEASDMTRNQAEPSTHTQSGGRSLEREQLPPAGHPGPDRRHSRRVGLTSSTDGATDRRRELKKRDPVCELTVGEGVCLAVDGYPQYGFCSEHCRDAFLNEPTQYNGEAVGNQPMSGRAVGERDDLPAH